MLISWPNTHRITKPSSRPLVQQLNCPRKRISRANLLNGGACSESVLGGRSGPAAALERDKLCNRCGVSGPVHVLNTWRRCLCWSSTKGIKGVADVNSNTGVPKQRGLKIIPDGDVEKKTPRDTWCLCFSQRLNEHVFHPTGYLFYFMVEVELKWAWCVTF